MCDFAADIAPSIVSCVIGASFLYWQQRQHSSTQAIEARHDASNAPSTNEAALKPHRVAPISDADDNVPRPRRPRRQNTHPMGLPLKRQRRRLIAMLRRRFDCDPNARLCALRDRTRSRNREGCFEARELIDHERLALYS